MRGFILDTNVFNHLVEGRISLEDLPQDFPVFVSHLQFDEISKCGDVEKRKKMQAHLKAIPDEIVATHSFVLGVSRLDQAALGDGEIFQKILDFLKTKNKKRINANINDALIGELAIDGGYVLITNDGDLKEAVEMLGGCVKSLTAASKE